MFLKRWISMLMILIQMLVSNVGYGLFFRTPVPGAPDPTDLVNDIRGDTPMDQSILYAKKLSNVPQACYTDGTRSAYVMTNSQIVLTHDLNDTKLATLAKAKGGVYLKDTMDVYYLRDGVRYYASGSAKNGRVNTLRLGEYYYECHVRDLDFGADSGKLFRADKAYHLYGDRLYQQISLLAAEASDRLEGYGVEIKLPICSVASLRCKTSDGVLTDKHDVSTDTARASATSTVAARFRTSGVPASTSCVLTRMSSISSVPARWQSVK